MGNFDRKIIHIDMDAFFAAVEQRDNPQLRNRPLIIAGAAERRGVVSTCSYEARKYGIHSAMPTKTALRLCPNGIFMEPNISKYVQVSQQIHNIFNEFSTQIERVSIDEAYLDVSVNLKNQPSATLLAQAIQHKIYHDTSLTASAGVSYNKFLAKIASDWNKPFGLTVIRPEQAVDFLEKLPISKFHGIGKVTAGRLLNMNVKCGKDLKTFARETLIELFGRSGSNYYDLVRGIDLREVETVYERKSIGKEHTFAQDVIKADILEYVLKKLSANISKSLKKRDLAGRTVTLKLRYENFQTITRRLSFHLPINETDAIFASAWDLLKKTQSEQRPVRLIGISVSNFPDEQKNDNNMIQLEFNFQQSLELPF